MDRDTFLRSLQWVDRLEKVDALALHNFGEPLLHPRFDEYAKAFSMLTPITMSTNATFLDEHWADRLAKVPWAWISVSPWDEKAMRKGIGLLAERGIKVQVPDGVTHNWAGQASGPSKKIFKGCPFLDQGKAVIRWDGSVASCCITDREEDAIGHITDEPQDVFLRGYSICEGCHHAV